MTSRLDEIATQAEVSRATVSRVLNGRAGAGERSRAKVLTAMDVLGYERPSRLRRHSVGLVGLVVPGLEDPVVPLLAQVISSELTRRDYTPVLCVRAPEGPDEDDQVTMLRERGVSGIVFVSGLHADPELDRVRYTALVAQGLPIVLINGHLDDVDAPSISCDHEVAGALAVAHLRAGGHERIGLVVAGGPQSSVRAQRDGYRAAVARGGGAGTEDLETETPDGIQGGYSGARRLLGRDASALVCGSDLIALGAVRAARAVGLSVPGDVSVVGYGDSLVMGHTDPPLTTVRQPLLDMGREAARMLLAEVDGQRAPRGETLYQPELVVRASTGPRDRPARGCGIPDV